MDNNVFSMIAELEAHIENSKKVPFTNQYVIDRETALRLVQMIRDDLPEAIKDANRVLKQESRILQDAKKHADNVMAEADAKARSVRMESEQRAALMVSNAKEEAQEMVTEAERQAEEMLSAAERKADELISQTSITIRAKQQANEILTNAHGEAQRNHRVTMDHIEDLLKRAEDVAIDVANQLRDSRMQIDQER